MNLLNLLILLFINSFSNLAALTCSLDDHNHGTNSDRRALLAIKSRISLDPQGVLNSWNDSLHICQWQGVTCGPKRHLRQRIVSLILPSKGFVGTLSPALGNLSFLHHVNLAQNDFHGNIPPQIGRLSRLRNLDLSNNSFGGQVPTNMSRCSNLEILSLGKNKLSGTIPLEFGLLSKLTTLVLHLNNLTGNLLDVVVNMTSLQILSASSNYFQGNIPQGIGQRTNLTYLVLGGNKFKGVLPPPFYNLSSLTAIDLQFNELEGSLPADIGSCFPQLVHFRISGNFFHGHFPVSLSNLTQLQSLMIYNNSFTGEFIFNAQNIPNLVVLDNSHNFFGTGKNGDLDFLNTLSNCTNLYSIQCCCNNFGGKIPDFLRGNWSSELMGLDFQHNQITGNIPSELINLVNLEILALNDNQLTGNIPHDIGKLAKLRALKCSNNKLAGNIPYSLGNLLLLTHLYLDNNSFVGAIPPTIGNCENLLYLWLSQNNLNGSLPSHLFNASMLVELEVAQNHLQGTFPVEIEKLQSLVLMDVSENSFSGDIPSNFGNCINLVELDVGGNSITGSIPDSFRSLSNLQYLNLSHNRLSGKIPDFLSNFSLIMIDLSFNNLDGEVPTRGAFANMSALSVLGNSNLCGGVSELHLPKCPYDSPIKLSRKKRKMSIKVTLIIVVVGILVGVFTAGLVYKYFWTRIAKNLSSGSSMKEPFMKVSYDLLLKATERFSDINIVGEGSYGIVYKGLLGPENMTVAIKVINLQNEGARKSFIAECKVLQSVRHRNLIKIVTVCSSTDFEGNDFKALIYEFMPNGNLQQWIYVDSDMDDEDCHPRPLSLLQRLNIAIDVAYGVEYLHNSCEVPIIHSDLKPTNILLDNDMVAHVGDFGLAKFHSHQSTSNSSSVAVKGTVGYTAPEYGLGSRVSKEGDVYSYGILLIEMLTATKPTDCIFHGDLNLHRYAKSAFPEQLANIIDPRLIQDITDANHYESQEESEGKANCVKSMIEIGLKCSAESPQDRMSIESAIRELESARESFVRSQHQQRHNRPRTATRN